MLSALINRYLFQLFPQKAPCQMLDWVLNAPLIYFEIWHKIHRNHIKWSWLIKSTPLRMFFWEFCDKIQSSFYAEHLWSNVLEKVLNFETTDRQIRHSSCKPYRLISDYPVKRNLVYVLLQPLKFAACISGTNFFRQLKFQSSAMFEIPSISICVHSTTSSKFYVSLLIVANLLCKITF